MVSYNPFSLEGKKILVTGASSGIGRAISIECSRMGAILWICGRSQERLEETKQMMSGKDHVIIAGDLNDESYRESIANEVQMLDGIVHNAGIARRKLTRQLRLEDINQILETNFVSVTLLQKELMKKKKLASSSSIVMMGSRAYSSPSIGNAVYAASKGALTSYAKVLALELAPKEIRVNVVCPGMVFTDLIRKEGDLMGVDFHDSQKKYPLGRFGSPEDIAYLTVFLLSDASKWITGSSIDISGGGELVLV